MIPWLSDDTPFPPVDRTLHSPNGLLAAGGDLSASRLLDAYRHGIFPWFNPGEPILWWSPDPRMVLIPDEFKVSRSLAKALRKSDYEVRTDTVFEKVMLGCAAPRGGHQGGGDTLLAKTADCGSNRPAASPSQGRTWINQDMITAYCELHRMGYAHSVEVWMNGNLAGGLYGVGIGHMFYGESMFSKVSNASKIALAHLARQFARWQLGNSGLHRTGMIDCQMKTSHLASLGAREIPRSEFIAGLKELVHCAPVTNWKFDDDLFP